jgi:YgiT-type zinc finger domain-containing protein
MFICHVCGSTEAREEYIDELFQIENRPVMVENIPAKVCVCCGEEILSSETTERIRRMLHGEAIPIKSILMDVFAFV